MNLTTLLSKFPVLSYGPRFNPLRDWFVILSVFALFLVVSIAWNAWFFYNVLYATPLETTGEVSVSSTLQALPNAQAALEQRAAEEAKYRTFYEFVDPSR